MGQRDNHDQSRRQFQIDVDLSTTDILEQISKIQGKHDKNSERQMSISDLDGWSPAEQELKRYIHGFFKSGKKIHERNIRYEQIEDNLHDELYDHLDEDGVMTITIDITDELLKVMGSEEAEKQKEQESEEKKVAAIDKQTERNYRFARDEEISEFYFRHFPYEYDMRKELLSACVKKNDIERATYLIDLMASTKGNPDYEGLNGWGRQNMLTLYYLIEEYAYGKEKSWDSSIEITDDMRKAVKELVYRMMPYLPGHSSRELKEKVLYKIDPQSFDAEEYISRLLEDADVYTSFPKPRGKGGAPNINRMSDEFMHCFERLSKMGRLDVVSSIMTKFASARKVLRPISFERWMSSMADELRNRDMADIFNQNRKLFEDWLSIENLPDYEILAVAHGIGNGCTKEEFQAFRKMVISRKGWIPGLDACFQATSENTETQELLVGNYVKVDLDYTEISGENPVSNITMNLITTIYNSEACSVRITKCMINDLETDDCGFICDMDEDPVIGYRLFGWKTESEDEFTVYSGFLEDNEINEVNRISLQFVVMDKDAEILEKFSEAVIELDFDTGDYKVTHVAKGL